MPGPRDPDASERTLGTPPVSLGGDVRITEGAMIGHYQVKRLIGAGGMGRVYEAQQENPRRTVAIKLMGKGVASASALRRFEFEAQVLAHLKHPGIAQIYEAGSFDDGTGGLPWFAMEYISNAKPITEYARDAKLGTRERMRLFKQACEAVAHGHQRGVIHRDLKPTNILVDGAGQVKVIDFGVARTTDSDMVVNTLQTDVGQLVGTVQYMSPEQFDADPHDLDIRSDVYALGVVMYELLSGRLPYDLRKKAIHEAARVVREEDPARLSTISPTLRGDLEVIVAKAMAKERGQRYASASALSDDIGRYLDQEPITARAPGVLETMRRFGKRHRVVSAAILAAFAVLSISVVVVSVLYLNLQRKSQEIAQKNDSLAFEQTLAENARREAEAARTHSDEALRSLQSETYVSAIRRATSAMSSGRTDIVSQEMDSIEALKLPDVTRRFEWRLLQAATHPELAVIDTHGGSTQAVACSPDARTIATAGDDGIVRLWNADTGSPLAELKGHASRVNALAFSPDGSLLASAGDDATVRLWDPRTTTGVCLGELKGHTGPVRAVAFASDGRSLATGSADRSIRLWDSTSHACTRTLDGHAKAVRAVAFTPDGTALASASSDGTVRVWNLAAATAPRTLQDHPGEVTCLALSPDARTLAEGFADGALQMWNLSDGTRIGTTTLDGALTGLSFAPTRAAPALLAATTKGVARIDPAKGTLLAAPTGERLPASSLTFLPDGTRYATGGNDGMLRVWDATATEFHERIPGLAAPARAIACAPGTAHVLATNGAQGSVQLWNTDGPRALATLTHAGESVRGIDFTPNGRLLVTGAADGALLLWNAEAGTLQTTLQASGPSIDAVAISPDGRTIASAGQDRIVRLWDLDTGKVFAQLTGHAGNVRSLAFAPDGALLASGSEDGAIRLWDVQTRALVTSLQGHEGAVRSLAFAPDGTTLASASHDRSVRLWSVARRAPLKVMQGHESEVHAIAFDPAGKTVASGSKDGTVRLWDATSGKELAVLDPKIGGVSSLAFMDDGSTLACGGEANAISMVRAEPKSALLPRRAAMSRTH
jgi:WD40 repeat protein/serine/threonine protein kinase